MRKRPWNVLLMRRAQLLIRECKSAITGFCILILKLDNTGFMLSEQKETREAILPDWVTEF